MHQLDLWTRTLAAARKRPAVTDSHGDWSYADLDDLSSHLAGVLHGHDVGAGSRVGTLTGNGAPILAAYLAVWKCGATVVPINPTTTVDGRRDHAQRAGVTVLLTDQTSPAGTEGLQVLDLPSGPRSSPSPQYAPRPRTPDRLAACFLTSATTGRAKLIGITDHHLAVSILAQQVTMPSAPGEAMVVCNPLSHGSMYFSWSFLLGGGRLVFPSALTPQAIIGALVRERASHVWLVPQTLQFLLRARGLATADLSALGEVVYAAAPMPADLLRTAHQTLACGFRQIYGMTEALLVATQTPAEHRFDESALTAATLPVGRAAPGMVVSVQDDDGAELPPGCEGRVCVKGDAVIEGYLPDGGSDVVEDADRRPGSWWSTGDLGLIDGDGLVHLTGRVSDMIIRGGQKIAPAEVERVIRTHPAVADVAVVGVPDPDWGEVPHACVVPTDATARIDDLLQFCVGRVSDHMRPVAVHILPELPVTPTGKIQRGRLREQLTGAAPTVAERLVAMLRQRLPDLPLAVAADVPLVALGVASREVISFLEDVDRAIGIDWDFVDATGARLSTLKDVEQALTAKVP